MQTGTRAKMKVLERRALHWRANCAPMYPGPKTASAQNCIVFETCAFCKLKGGVRRLTRRSPSNLVAKFPLFESFDLTLLMIPVFQKFLSESNQPKFPSTHVTKVISDLHTAVLLPSQELDLKTLCFCSLSSSSNLASSWSRQTT